MQRHAAAERQGSMAHLFKLGVGQEGNAKHRSHNLAILDDLIDRGAYNVHRDGLQQDMLSICPVMWASMLSLTSFHQKSTICAELVMQG